MGRTERQLPQSLRFFFDYRMQTLKGQPPGSISFNVQSVRNWERS